MKIKGSQVEAYLKYLPKLSVPILAILLIFAFYIRIIPFFKYAHYGIWLQYDDSMFEYWLSKVLYQHGIGYWWQLTPQHTKYLWWWPWGRDVRTTETPGLSFTGALLYPIAKAFGLRLVDWVGIVPAFYGALTSLAVAVLGWIIGGPLLSIISVLSVAFQYAFLQRSIASFVEKMSPTTFFSTLFLVTFAILVKKYDKVDEKKAFVLGFLGGVVLALSSAFWSGFLAFLGVTIIAYAIIPFLNVNKRFYLVSVIYSIAVLIGFLSSSWWITTLWASKLKYVAMLTIGIMAIENVIIYFLVNKFEEQYKKYWAGLIIAVIAIALILAHTTHVLHRLLTTRYLIMLMPWLRRAASPLERSVAEHQGILDVISFSMFPQVFGLGMMAPLAVLYAIILLRSNDENKVKEVISSMPLLAMALFATYLITFNVSTYLLTLMGFMVGLGGALFLYWVLKDIKDSKSLMKLFLGTLALVSVLVLLSGISAGITYAFSYPPPSYLSAGTAFYTPLFPKTMEFMKTHCKFALAWWDYGYMIGTVANVTTVVDPATLNGTQIALVAKALTGTEKDLMHVAKALRLPPNETCVFAYEVFPYVPGTKTIVGIPQVGDFAKSIWMLRIRGLKDSQIFGHYIFYLVNGITLDDKQVSLIIRKPSDIQVVGNTARVVTMNGNVVILKAILQIVPIVNVNSALLYKMIYDGVVKSGYKFVDPGFKTKPIYQFKHLKLLKAFVEDLYIPNTNKALPNIKAVSVVYLYTG